MITPSPVAPVFTVFTLPPEERLAALIDHLDRGADPNAIDPRLNRNESLLAHACRALVMKGEVLVPDPQLVNVLLDRGANPLVSQIWGEETGEMTDLVDRMAFLAWEDRDHSLNKDTSTPCMDIMDSLLVACKVHGHRDQQGQDALCHMVKNLSAYSHMHYLHSLRHAIELGFDLTHPVKDKVGDAPTVINYLITRHAGSLVKKHWAWKCVAPLLEAGLETGRITYDQRNIWGVVDVYRDIAQGSPDFDGLQATRQAFALRQTTPASAPSKMARRV